MIFENAENALVPHVWRKCF